MKKILEIIPFLLLIITIGLTYHFGNGIPQSIIIFGLTGLCGYRFYCMEQSKPDYVGIFQEQFDQYKEQRDTELKEMQVRHEKAIVFLEAKIKELDNSYGKMTMEKTKPKMKTEFAF